MPKNLLEPDFAEPYTAWKTNPSPENTGAVLKALDPVIGSALRAFAGPSVSSPTLRSHAKLLAIDALHSYDPAKAPLKAHMMTRLQRIRRTASQQRQVIRVPEQVAMDQMMTDHATKELEDTLGRVPSDQELADHTGLSLKRLTHIRTGLRPVAESTITRAGEEGTGQYDPASRPIHEQQDSWNELVYSDMDATNQFIMERALGMHGHEPARPSDIARQLKISPAAVSHRMAQIQQKLDLRDTLKVL